MTENDSNKIQSSPGEGHQSRSVGGYNPGGQAGKSVQEGGQAPLMILEGLFWGSRQALQGQHASEGKEKRAQDKKSAEIKNSAIVGDGRAALLMPTGSEIGPTRIFPTQRRSCWCR
jgi:hypothetical protein